MKAKLHLTIDPDILERIKAYAAARQISISELVECYFKNLISNAGKPHVIHPSDKLHPDDTERDTVLRDLYHKERKHKYGF